jgi:hypothetical protein
MPKFTKGQSGNPGGRPKEVADIKALARAHTDVALSALVAIVKDKGASANARVAALLSSTAAMGSRRRRSSTAIWTMHRW